jgi:DNA-binding transcriptional MocR family regulator
VDLGEPVSSALAERALAFGVRIEGGGYFATEPGLFEQRLRIPYSAPSPALQEAARRLASALPATPTTPPTPRPHWVA